MGALDDFLSALDWAEITVRLTAFALRKTRDPVEAEEVAQQALSQFLDPGYKQWSPEVPTREGLLRHLGSAVNGIIANNWRRRARRGRNIEVDDEELRSPVTADGEVNQTDWACDVLGRLDGDSDACKVFYLIVDNMPKAADEAAELGWPVTKAYEVRRRIKKKLQNSSEDP